MDKEWRKKNLPVLEANGATTMRSAEDWVMITVLLQLVGSSSRSIPAAEEDPQLFLTTAYLSQKVYTMADTEAGNIVAINTLEQLSAMENSLKEKDYFGLNPINLANKSRFDLMVRGILRSISE